MLIAASRCGSARCPIACFGGPETVSPSLSTGPRASGNASSALFDASWQSLPPRPWYAALNRASHASISTRPVALLGDHTRGRASSPSSFVLVDRDVRRRDDHRRHEHHDKSVHRKPQLLVSQ
jgi:hypothetical protein